MSAISRTIAAPRHLRTADAIVVHVLFVVVTLALYVWVRPLAGWEDASLLSGASALLLVQLIWSLASWRLLTGSVFDPYGLFVIAAMLFNAGAAFLFLIGANTAGLFILDFSFPADQTLRTLLLIFLCMAAFHFGALLLAGAQPGPLFPGTVAVPDPSVSAAQIRFVGWAFVVISIVPTAILLKQAVDVVLAAGYFGLYQVNYATGLGASTQFLGSFIVPGALVLLAGSKESRAGRIATLAVIALYALIQLFLGARYRAIGPVIAYAWLWHRTIRPLPRVLIASAAAVVLLVIFPVIAATRDTTGAERLSIQTVTNAFTTGTNPFVAVLNETEGTTVTIAHTLDLVPSSRDYDRGAQYLYAASSLVPNLFWDVHPATKRGLAGDWLVWQVDPDFAANGGGFGYSFIAEAYLNWGWIGGPLFLGIVGFLFAKLIYWGCRTGAPAKLAVVACFLSFVLFWARGEAIDVVRPLVWYALVPYLLIRFVAYIDRRGTGLHALWERARAPGQEKDTR